jgi:hypothetical protein
MILSITRGVRFSFYYVGLCVFVGFPYRGVLVPPSILSLPCPTCLGYYVPTLGTMVLCHMLVWIPPSPVG